MNSNDMVKEKIDTKIEKQKKIEKAMLDTAIKLAKTGTQQILRSLTLQTVTEAN